MRRLRGKTGPTRLRVRLLAPLILMIVVGEIGLIASNQILARRETAIFVNQRGATVLEGIAKQIRERQRAKEIFAQLLADQDNLAVAVERGSQSGLAQLLVPLKTKLGLGHIEVYTVEGEELVHLGAGGEEDEDIAAPLVTSAVAGLTTSTATVGANGLVVLASTPIKGPRGIVGALVVGTTLGGDALNEIKDRESVELAIFRDGRLIASTLDQPEFVQLVAHSSPEAGELTRLNRDLLPLNFQAVARSLARDGLLLALVPIEDLVFVFQQRNQAVVVVGLVLVALLALVGTVLTRDIARPLESIVAITRQLARGNYERRVLPSNIRELNELADAVNQLAKQLEIQLAELAHLALHDPLTNLPNRAVFMERLKQILTSADRRKPAVAVLFLDLDNFKVINDSLGHHTGDQLLVAVAQRLQACLRARDTLTRFGGDEFTILLEDISDMNEAIRVAERIQEQLRAPFALNDRAVFTSASIGVALSNHTEQTQPASLMRAADIAMYQAKARGKMQYAVFDRSMGSIPAARLELETALRQALERGEFRVYYQPALRLDTGTVTGIEALVRWQHPERGLLLPAEFIAVAEETGLIVPLGHWVLEEACRQTRAWQIQSPGPPSLRVSVNLSARQFQHSGLADDIGGILQETGLDPHALELEITESVVMEQGRASLTTLRKLLDLGVQLAIDDFGIAHSSLAYLKQFPVQTLKIDRSFVKGLGHDTESAAIVQAIISLAKALNLDVVAEGIETREQLDQLRALGCRQGQGFYFARPLTSEAVTHLLTGAPTASTSAGQHTL